MKLEEIKKNYPLHYYVWQNDYLALDEILKQNGAQIELKDPHGRTPLMLSVTLGHLESSRVLVRHNANVRCESKNYWSVTQEAISTGDPELVKILLTYRDAQLVRNQAMLVNNLLKKLCETPDFYIEMKWEFTSWLPLVSRMCPNDICRVWKRDASVRIDTNLIGFNGSSACVRGHLSYIFRVTDSGAVMDEVNHTDRTIYRHTINLFGSDASEGVSANSGVAVASVGPEQNAVGASAAAAANLFVREPSEDLIARKLTQPVFVTVLETGKIEFEKSKSGFWGWRSDRKEMINKHECSVYAASNVQIVTLRRTEHLTEENLRDLQRSDSKGVGGITGVCSPEDDCIGSELNFAGSQMGSNPLTSLLKLAQNEDRQALSVTQEAASYNPNQITVEDYFSPEKLEHGIDIGRPKVMTTKVKTFKARLWMCQDYPLSLNDQVLPIVDLMSEYNPYFNKLKEFLTKQLPSGFPMKIEIPLYHVLNASISFGNLYGEDSPPYGVTCLLRSPETSSQSGSINQQQHLGDSADSSSKLLPSGQLTNEPINSPKCNVDESVFDVGRGYHIIHENSPGHYGSLDEEEQLVQMAVQRSIVEYGGSDQLLMREYSLQKRSLLECHNPEYVDPEEAMLQKAIVASLSVEGEEIPVTSADEAYLKAIEASKQELLLEEKRARAEEEELKRVLEMSKQVK